MSITTTTTRKEEEPKTEDLIEAVEKVEEEEEQEVSPLSERVASTKLSKTLHDRLVQRCNSQGANVSNYLKQLVRDDLKERRRAIPLSQESASKETINEFALNRLIDEIDDLKDELPELIEERIAKAKTSVEPSEIKALKTKIQSYKAALDCVLEELHDREVNSPISSTKLQDELARSMNGQYGQEGKKSFEELCSKLSKAYGEKIEPQDFIKTDFVALAKKTA